MFASSVSRHGQAFIVDQAFVCSEKLGQRPGALEGDACACRDRVCDETANCSQNDRARGLRRMPLLGAQPVLSTVSAILNAICAEVEKGYVAPTSSAHWVRIMEPDATTRRLLKTSLNALQPSDWQRLSWCQEQGPRLHDWCYLELADLEAEESNDKNHRLWTRGLLIRRQIADGELAYSPMVSRRNIDRDTGQCQGTSLGDRRQLRGPPRTNSVSTAERILGMAGIVMSRSSCLPSP